MLFRSSRLYAGYRNTFAFNELWRIFRPVYVPGAGYGHERTYAPLRELKRAEDGEVLQDSRQPGAEKFRDSKELDSKENDRPRVKRTNHRPE